MTSLKGFTLVASLLLFFGSLSANEKVKSYPFQANPCFKASQTLVENPSSQPVSKEKLARAQKIVEQKLKILKENSKNPRLALQKQSGIELEECQELMNSSVNCTFSKCQELQKSVHAYFETMPESEVQVAFDTFLAVYSSVADPQQAHSLTETFLVPELQKSGRKLNEQEVETFKQLEKNESDVEAKKKSKEQGYLDAVKIMEKGLSAYLNGSEKKALQESKKAAEAFARGEIDEAELQVRSIEAHAKAAGEQITPQEREFLLKEIRQNLKKP